MERIPQETGVYLVEGDKLRTIKHGESKVVNNKGRNVLKVLAPIPIVSGKATVELDGEHSQNVVTSERPEFYIRPQLHRALRHRQAEAAKRTPAWWSA